MRTVAEAVTDGNAIVTTLGSISTNLGRPALVGRFQTWTTLAFADSFATLDLAAAGLGALEVDFPETIVVADSGGVIGGVTLSLCLGTLDFLVAMSVTSRPDMAGTVLGAGLDHFPTSSAAKHDR